MEHRGARNGFRSDSEQRTRPNPDRQMDWGVDMDVGQNRTTIRHGETMRVT